MQHIEFNQSPWTKDWQPVIYDATMREGMQTPGGIGASLEEKIYAANIISQFCDWMEIGMPGNDVDMRDLATIVQSLKEAKSPVGISVLCRNTQSDIDRAEIVLADYPLSMAHMFIGTSEEHRNIRKNGAWNVGDYEKNICESVAYASRKKFSRIMFSPEDAFRTFIQSEKDFFGFVSAAQKGFAQNAKGTDRIILNIPDTIGKSSILEYMLMLHRVYQVKGKSIEISIHGHNDTGASIQQAIECYRQGQANWIQTTFGGLGERNGIASTEAILAAFNERGWFKDKPYSDPKHLAQLAPATTAILAAYGKTVPATAPVSGSQVNISVAGIHTALASVDFNTYHVFADKYGAHPTIEFAATSGAHQLMPILKELDIQAPKESEQVSRFATTLKTQCNKEKRSLSVTDIMYEAIHTFNSDFVDPLRIMSYLVTKARGVPQKFDLPVYLLNPNSPYTYETRHPVRLEIEGVYHGKKFAESSTMQGTVEATMDIMNSVINDGTKLELVQFTPEVRPKIPAEFLSWIEKPKIPNHLAMDSDYQITVGIRNKNDPAGRIYTGFARIEDTATAPLEATLDAAIKMTAISAYLQQMTRSV